MRNKLYSGVAALAFASLVGSAMAASTDTDVVNVNIEVEEQVWLDPAHDNIQLVIDGGAINEDLSASSLTMTSNIETTIMVGVEDTGTTPMPAPIVPGGGIQFYIFADMNEAAALAALVADNYNPLGAVSWNYAEINTPGNEQVLKANIPPATSIVNIPIVYGAATPGEVTAPGDFGLTVTYTIAGS